jgi:hypothetical protein
VVEHFHEIVDAEYRLIIERHDKIAGANATAKLLCRDMHNRRPGAGHGLHHGLGIGVEERRIVRGALRNWIV